MFFLGVWDLGFRSACCLWMDFRYSRDFDQVSSHLVFIFAYNVVCFSCFFAFQVCFTQDSVYLCEVEVNSQK